jgi:hypothetical protein
MRLPSPTLVAAIERILRQRRAVTVLHLCALVVVTSFCWFGHIVPLSTGRGGSTYALMYVWPSWVPLLVSWGLVRDPNEGELWFRLWQVLFVLINVAACLVFIGYAPFSSPSGAFGRAVLFTVALAIISPFARGPYAPAT